MNADRYALYSTTPTTEGERQAFIDALVEDYPGLFKEWKMDELESCMAWGLCIGNGWLTTFVQLCDDLNDLAKEGIWFAQVKEKFGYLRVYLHFSEELIGTPIVRHAENLVRWAETLSGYRCETCGKPGKPRGGGWIKTLCAEHSGEQEESLRRHRDNKEESSGQ